MDAFVLRSGAKAASTSVGRAAAAPPGAAMELATALRSHFGLEALREGQRRAVDAWAEGRDAMVLMATGGGKSLCYQVPPLVAGGAVLVVSPLVSLMQDQVTKTNYHQGSQVAVLLGTAQNDRSVEDRAFRGEFRLVYVTPEKLAAGGIERLDALHRSGRLLLVRGLVARVQIEFSAENFAIGCWRRACPASSRRRWYGWQTCHVRARRGLRRCASHGAASRARSSTAT